MSKKSSIIMAIVLLIVFIVLFVGAEAYKNKKSTGTAQKSNNSSELTVSNSYTQKIFNQDDLFSNRDLKQEADLTGSTKYEVSNGNDISITTEGVYVISGTAENVTINVKAADDEKIQLVLDNLNITNTDKECIHVESADKVFVTIANQNSLKYSTNDTENLTGVVFSRSDITFNGSGTLEINSDNNGIEGKDDVKFTGGTYNINAKKNCVRANDSICIAGGTLNLESGTDGLHAEYSDDDTKGYIYINS